MFSSPSRLYSPRQIKTLSLALTSSLSILRLADFNICAGTCSSKEVSERDAGLVLEVSSALTVAADTLNCLSSLGVGEISRDNKLFEELFRFFLISYSVQM
jgi:polysaccharide pyruvyl transferase WcaK-like protein